MKTKENAVISCLFYPSLVLSLSKVQCLRQKRVKKWRHQGGTLKQRARRVRPEWSWMWLSDLRQTAKNNTDYRQNEKKIPTTDMVQHCRDIQEHSQEFFRGTYNFPNLQGHNLSWKGGWRRNWRAFNFFWMEYGGP